MFNFGWVKPGLHLAPALCLLLAAQTVQAQGLYRCGNTYQDRPCSGTDGKKLSGGTAVDNKTASAGAKAAMIDGECQQRGKDAQKIVWAREGGMTEEMMMGKARSPEEKKLVQDVYSMRAPIGEVKAAIEASCMADKSRAQAAPAPTAAVAGNAAKAGPAGSSPSSSAATASTPKEDNRMR